VEDNVDKIRRIRTYKEDIADAIREQKASLTSITAAEQKRFANSSQEIEDTTQTDFKKIFTIIGGGALIILGIAVIGFFLFFYEKEEVPIENEAPSLIFVEKQKKIDITGKNSREILQTLEAERMNTNLSLGQIVQLYTTEKFVNIDSEYTKIITAEEFLTKIQANVSGTFTRSVEPLFMLGIHVFNKNQPFIILKSNSYENSFAGMLDWEESIYNDLFLFMGRNADTESRLPTDTETGEIIPLKNNFEDKIIQNIDVRALTNVDGNIEFLYAFPNRQTIIITTNENTLGEIITRLNSVRVF
jgi:hypothetical protein